MEMAVIATNSTQSSVSLREILEAFAGYQPKPDTGTRVLLFGACAADGHARCPEHTTVAATTYLCRCTCHAGIDPADFDAAYGTAWWAETSEGA